ncbi:MAG: B12-binding domain-containing radical SAM protein [Pseudomonadota bacterium]|nr:B12-binding domain-containing radical SAM protein [Pseudomonadota bacterium]
MASIVLINPKFEISFWGLEHALPLMGKRANMPVAALPLIAALTPDRHSITIIDENVEAIDFEMCARADIVGVTGMIVQRQRIREILGELRRRKVFTVAGGPWVSVNEAWFDNLADVVFIGEAEETWPQFLSDWESGRQVRRYEQAEKTDMAKVPAPRLDLLKTERYAFGSVQFSRGCPFTCEFCDIIVIFGRRPRLKTGRQVIAELEALRARKLANVFIVDDNLIGNRKAIKEVLRHVIEWQRANDYPLMFATEASLDLADDEELMRLMVEANISALFVGIESTNEESLKETKKLQNLRRGGTMIEKVRRIQERGMEVWAGMIVGFDNDDATVFAAQRRFITDARVTTAMVGMLSAIPRTPLYDRMKAAGRLDESESPAHGTNVLPVNMTRDELSDGYIRLMAELYESGAYFDRLDDLYRSARITIDRAWQEHVRARRWPRWKRNARCLLETFVLITRLVVRVPERRLRRVYRQRFWAFLRARPEPQVLRIYALKCAIHWHMHKFVGQLTNRTRPLINTY